MSSKTPIAWLATIRQGEKGWHEFYKEFMRQPISQPERFFKAVESLGEVTVFNSIIIASLKKLEGDPLPYILAIAMNRITEDVKDVDIADKYELAINKAKHRTELQNESLEKKLQKAKEITSGDTK